MLRCVAGVGVACEPRRERHEWMDICNKRQGYVATAQPQMRNISSRTESEQDICMLDWRSGSFNFDLLKPVCCCCMEACFCVVRV